MKHEPTNSNELAPRPGRLILLCLVIAAALGASMAETAFAEDKHRKPVLPRLTSDIDNEGPVTRRPGERPPLGQRDRRAALAGWRGVIRLDLILPIRMPAERPAVRPWDQ